MLPRPLSLYRAYGKIFYSYGYLHPACGAGVQCLNPPCCSILHHTIFYCFLSYSTLPYPTLSYPTVSISSSLPFYLSYSTYSPLTLSLSLPLYFFQGMWSMQAVRRKGFRICHRVSANSRYALVFPSLLFWYRISSLITYFLVPVFHSFLVLSLLSPTFTLLPVLPFSIPQFILFPVPSRWNG